MPVRGEKIEKIGVSARTCTRHGEDLGVGLPEQFGDKAQSFFSSLLRWMKVRTYQVRHNFFYLYE